MKVSREKVCGGVKSASAYCIIVGRRPTCLNGRVKFILKFTELLWLSVEYIVYDDCDCSQPFV